MGKKRGSSISDTTPPQKGNRTQTVLIVAIVLLSLAAVILTLIYFLYPKVEPVRDWTGPPKRVYGERLEEAAVKEEQLPDGRTEERIVLARKIFSDEEGTCVADECQYDRFGNPIQRTWYGVGGNIRYWEECYYDAAGNMTEAYRYSGDGSIWDYYYYDYDEAGNQIWEAYYIDDYCHIWIEREFDGSGNQTMELRQDRTVTFSQHRYEYDEAGRRIRDIVYNADGSIQTTNGCVYEFDDSGNVTGENWYDQEKGAEGLWYWWEGAYDADGNLVTESGTLLDDGSLYQNRGIYTSPDNLFEAVGILESSGQYLYQYKHEYGYDAAGNEIKRIIYNADGSIREWYEYEYDASGRMLREISYQPDGSLDYQYDYEYMTITVIPRP